jgi:hypothetical protein
MGDQGLVPSCVDFAALPALAGDHSCSPKDVVVHVVPGRWVLDVARVGAETKAALASARSPSAIFNRSATMNLELQGVDPAYLTRAGANSAHFLLAREHDDLASYVTQSVRRGAKLNALGLYVRYHAAALALAHERAFGTAKGSPSSVAARDVLALESYALHWLEDSFAAGHAVGTWGSDAWRKGTHDHYGEHGFDTTTWAGERVVLHGDSYMRPADRERASRLAATSLSQVAHALAPGDRLGASLGALAPDIERIYAFDSCVEEEHAPTPAELSFATDPELVALLRDLPVPGQGPEGAHLPRVREEFGAFVGAFGAVAGGLAGGATRAVRPSFDLAAGLRFGYAAPAIVGTVGTAKAFVESGLVLQSSQSQACETPECDASPLVDLLPRVPSRTGLRVGVRMPFYVVPGDLLVLGPVLLAVSPSTLAKVGIAATRGGLVPYERSFRTPAGFVQVVAGREVDLTFFGFLADALEFRELRGAGSTVGVVRTRSVRARFPVVEWTPVRSFATNTTFAAPVQLGVGFEAATSAQVVFPEGQGAPLGAIAWDAFLRVQLDTALYFGAREDTR